MGAICNDIPWSAESWSPTQDDLVATAAGLNGPFGSDIQKRFSVARSQILWRPISRAFTAIENCPQRSHIIFCSAALLTQVSLRILNILWHTRWVQLQQEQPATFGFIVFTNFFCAELQTQQAEQKATVARVLPADES
jgi:hypothetical protein